MACVLAASRRTACRAAYAWLSSVPARRCYSSGSHDDFQPKATTDAPVGVMGAIRKDVTENEVMLYMKGYPEQPMCGFSARVVALLNGYGVKFASRNVLDDEELRQGIKEYSSWPTIPQLYVRGEFVGGCDLLWEAHEKGEFMQTLKGEEK